MLLFLAFGVVILFILNITIGFALKHQFDRNLRPHLIQYLHYVQQEIGDPPDIDRAKDLAQRAGIEIYLRGPGMNWSSGGEALNPTDIRFRRPPRRAQRGRHLTPHLRPFAIGDYRDRLVLRTRIGDNIAYLSIPKRSGPGHAVVVLLSATVGVLAALLIMYWMIRRLFRPVQVIKEIVQGFGDGDLYRRIQIDRKDELADLGHSINNMADDIQQMLEAKRQLLLAVSHELRSPITRARVSTELLDDSKLKQNLVKDLSEMETLVAEMLETERLNTRHAVLNRRPTPVRQMVRDILRDHFYHHDIRTQLPDGDVYVMIDEPRVKLLIMNLLSNAERHSGDTGQPPELSIQTTDKQLLVQVRDCGPGIKPQDVPHVTEPFYRADPSRRRQTGGYGLGLYLCRLIAEAHGGQLSIESVTGEGTTVTVEIPITTEQSKQTD